MSIGVAQATWKALVVDHLAPKWTKTVIASLAPAVDVSFPVHSHDEICPLFAMGQHYDPDDPPSPFSAAEIRDSETGNGCGFIVASLSSGMAKVVTPGTTPEVDQEIELRIEIFTPAGRGAQLSRQYAAALGSVLQYVGLDPGTDGILEISTGVAAILPMPEGSDGAWRLDLYRQPGKVIYLAAPVSVAA